MKNFWTELRRPIFCLAPMADVTDGAFRRIIAKYARYNGEDVINQEGKFTRQNAKRVGGPDIFFTEFVSADGLCSAGKDKLLVDFIYGENERPIVAQIFGSNLENIRQASALCKELRFDGIDINLGCPDRSVEKQGAGAAMIKNPKLAREIIRAARGGADGLPISVKTRIGYNPPAPKGFGRASRNENYLLDEQWIKSLLEENLAALTIHLRTRKEMSAVPAHWDLMKRIVEIRDEMKKDTLILGNGDVMNLEEARQKVKETGCDGIMLGRAIFGNPWLFAPSPLTPLLPLIRGKPFSSPDKGRSGGVGEGRGEVNLGGEEIKHKLQVLVEHTKLFEKMLGQHKNFAIMKKHYKAYVNGFEGAKELRVKLMETENTEQVEKIVKEWIQRDS